MHAHIARTLVMRHQEDLGRMAARWRRRKPSHEKFLDEPEGLGARVYLTIAESRQLFAEWERLLARFAEPKSVSASEYELVMLGRRTGA